MSSQGATVTLPASQYIAFIRVFDLIKKHLVEEHAAAAPNAPSWPRMCSSCEHSLDNPEEILEPSRHWGDTLYPCWIRLLLEEMKKALP
jgi:hypothetical protein